MLFSRVKMEMCWKVKDSFIHSFIHSNGRYYSEFKSLILKAVSLFSVKTGRSEQGIIEIRKITSFATKERISIEQPFTFYDDRVRIIE